MYSCSSLPISGRWNGFLIYLLVSALVIFLNTAVREILLKRCCCSVSKLCLTLQPHELQHARLPCPSLSPKVCSNSCPLTWWCHPTISSSVTLFFCLRSFPASGYFPVSWLFTTGDQSIEASTSASVLPMNIQGWCPVGLTGLISMQSEGLKVESSSAPQFESISSSVLSLPHGPTLTSVHDYWKNHSSHYISRLKYKFDNSTPVLKNLQGLPFSYQVKVNPQDHPSSVRCLISSLLWFFSYRHIVFIASPWT